MVKAPFYLFEIEMEIFSRHSPIMIKPVFSIRPKAFDAINVIAAFRSTFFFANNNVIASNIKECVSKSVIGILKASWLSMLSH